MGNLGNEDLIREIQSFRNQLKDQALFSSSDLNENYVMIQTMLQKHIKPLIDFPLDLSLPKNISKWSSAKEEQYLINLYLHLFLSDGVNLGNIYYQLGILYLKKEGEENIAYYYLEKAWDHGIQFDSLSKLLNNILSKQALQPIPWE